MPLTTEDVIVQLSVNQEMARFVLLNNSSDFDRMLVENRLSLSDVAVKTKPNCPDTIIFYIPANPFDYETEIKTKKCKTDIEFFQLTTLLQQYQAIVSQTTRNDFLEKTENKLLWQLVLICREYPADATEEKIYTLFTCLVNDELKISDNPQALFYALKNADTLILDPAEKSDNKILSRIASTDSLREPVFEELRNAVPFVESVLAQPL